VRSKVIAVERLFLLGGIVASEQPHVGPCGTKLQMIGETASGSSIRLARVTGPRLGDEHDVERIIWAVPDSPSPGNLVLPLLQHLAPDSASAQVAAQPMLPAGVGPVSGLSGQNTPGFAKRP
jgi:hypothetical protein